MLYEQRHPPLTVFEVRKHRPREQLLPKCLPEALDFPASLRMMRATLDVRYPMAAQFRLKLRRPAPSRVLPTLVGQDLTRRSIVRHPS